ncbi:MAG: disulfide bond formation protein B [Novosphingobium sp.]
MTDRARLGRWLALALPAALLGGAYVSQYAFGLYPCEMCWWQRWPHFAALPLAAIGIATGRNPFTWLALAAVVVSGLIGGFHAGVEYGWWEGMTACATTSVAGGDPLKAIMNAPIVRCDVAPWTLAGISLAGFNFLASLGGALLGARLLGGARP